MKPESSFEPRSSISYDSLSSEVRGYAYNLEAGIRAILRNYDVGLEPWDRQSIGLTSIPDLRNKKISIADRGHLADLLEQLDHIRRTGEPIERTRREIEETIPTIIVKEAINPWRVALIKGGISPKNEDAQEKIGITYNLQAILGADIASYRASGFEHWAKALEELDPFFLRPEVQSLIEAELKEGTIPIFMPGARVQAETTPEQYETCFKPVSIKEGIKETTGRAVLYNHLTNLISSRDLSLITNVPEYPYLLLVRPTQYPEVRTRDKDIDKQKIELEKINQERAANGLSPVFSIKPFEYGALQQRFTELVNLQISKLANLPINLSPLDRETLTRFIDLPLYSDGRALGSKWSSESQRVKFLTDSTDRHPRYGFRYVVRIVL